jgi:uncharacterized protein (DUF2249 family)
MWLFSHGLLLETRRSFFIGEDIVSNLGSDLAPGAAPLCDEHSVLLWQTCAYADDLRDASRTGRRLAPAHDAMLEFLHYRLLPYLTDEERRLSRDRLRDDHLLETLVADHERLRADVDNVEWSRTRRLVALAAAALDDRLDRHVRREESWLASSLDDAGQADVADWALPLLVGDLVDLDALPAVHRDALVRRRLAWLHPGESVRIRANHDLHRLWRRLHASQQNAYSWLYEEDGPSSWRVRITRRADQIC